MVIPMEALVATGINMAIPMEVMVDMARDLLTPARTTLLTPLSRTGELQRQNPRQMLKQVGKNIADGDHIKYKLTGFGLGGYGLGGLGGFGFGGLGGYGLGGLGLGYGNVLLLEVTIILLFFSQEDMEDCTEEVYMAVVFMVAMDCGRSIINTD